MKVGDAGILCPTCEETILVPVTCEIDNNENAWLGEARFVCEPDMTDLWAHMWTHETQN